MLPAFLGLPDSIAGPPGTPLLGLTTEHYMAVWRENQFYRNVINSAELLRPIFGELSPTLYGQPSAVIAVLVAINQPFTIWMLRSFFQNIPGELDEAARVDNCSHIQAFRQVIMPVMWPGVITTGLFSFLPGYNDFLVTSLLLDAQNQTMLPAIAGCFNRETTTTHQVEAVAAAVSITAPLVLLVMVFQRQIVSGLTAGPSRDDLPLLCSKKIPAGGSRTLSMHRGAIMKGARSEQAVLSRDTDMSRTDASRAVIAAMVAGLNDHRIDDIGQFFAPGFRWMGNTGCGTKTGLQEVQDNWQRPLQAACFEKVCVDDVRLFMGEGAAAFGQQDATHSGPFMGVAPTGMRVEIRVMDFWKVKDGRITGTWVMVDFPHVLAPLGVDVFNGEGWDAFERGARQAPHPAQ